MLANLTNRFATTAKTGLLVLTLGAGLLTMTGSASASPIDHSDNPAEATCTYASKTYKEGEKVKQDDGNEYRCNSNGTWVLALVAPPQDVRTPRVIKGVVSVMK